VIRIPIRNNIILTDWLSSLVVNLFFASSAV
jgi:hypothetical protein